MSHSTADFIGTDRFRIRRRLGSGGMGVVYEAYDRDTDKVLALKALTRTEAAHISRFKNEFRSLADVSHPNLVSLYEFMSDGHYWFFTMELVQGVNFLEYVRPGYRARRSQSSLVETLQRSSVTTQVDNPADYEAETQQLDAVRLASLSGESSSPSETSLDTRLSRAALDLDRLNNALHQLAEGLHALHETGKLHRDIKPSNVLVTKEGRVVILDFGLVAEVAGKGLHESVNLAGTPDYMSPEQGAQLPISRSSDWYSVGVMLYQALVGRLPFSGKFFEVMMDKQNLDPPAPSELIQNVPPELNTLCVKLLRRIPERRPSGRQILRILGDGKTGPLKEPLMASEVTLRKRRPFVGRDRQIRELMDAFEATRQGQTVTCYVHGESGVGKSALVRNFLDELRERESDTVILEGRCYERESVPYKALDGVIDSLTKFLMALPEAKVAALLPRDVLALARLFPVMLQVDAVFNAPQREKEVPDPFVLRRRAFDALRELLGRISDRQRLIIYIDDLHWSDSDSTNLLEDLLRPPDSPPLLLLASFRSEEIETKPFLEALLESAGTETRRELRVTTLSDDEARVLAQSLLDAAPEPVIASIAREARGNPFLLEQLARYAAASEQSATRGINLGVMLDARLAQLPQGTRQFVHALAVAGRPINPEVAYHAAGLSGDELPLVSTLRAAQFLRSGGSEHTVELYHDRIRETLAAQLDRTSVIQIHRRLAQAIETRGIDDPESLFEHYMGAGEQMRAAAHAAAAARKAAAALAFDRAAGFYRRALELAPGRGAEMIAMKRGLAEALVNAGRPAEAAQAYLDLAKETSAAQALESKRRAAEQLLIGGHIKEGLELVRSVLAAVGFKIPEGPKRALLSLLLKRIRIRMRGLNFTERKASEIPEAELFRIDICWAVAAGLGAVDLIRGADFQCRHLLLALEAGEPFRVARGLAVEAAQTASRGGPSQARAVMVTQQAEALAQRVGHPHAYGLAIWAKGLTAYLNGRWKTAAQLCEQSAEILRDQCTGVTWELSIAHRFLFSAMVYLGEIGEVSRRVPSLLAAALDQGNVFTATDLRTRLNLIWLAADDPDRAREEAIEALKAWPHEGFHLQHYSAMLALAQIELYTGDTEFVWRHLEGQWPALENSLLLRIQVLRIEAMHLQARAALATVRSSKERSRRLKLAELLAKRIIKENKGWANPFASLVRAGIANSKDDKTAAATLLSEAATGFRTYKMELYAAACRRRLGEVVGDEHGRNLISETTAWMSSQRIKNPDAMTRMLAPGFE
jgi:serine/threonine protein kinase/tetratricopeptide (TPR) repeat protein